MADLSRPQAARLYVVVYIFETDPGGPRARRARNLRFSSGDTLVSHRGGRSCGFPMLKGAFVTSFSQPARSCARVAHFEKNCCIIADFFLRPHAYQARGLHSSACGHDNTCGRVTTRGHWRHGGSGHGSGATSGYEQTCNVVVVILSQCGFMPMNCF